VVDAVELLIRELLGEFPTLPATVIAERIGWERRSRSCATALASCDRCSCRPIRVNA
jgi:hypothetical protein